MAPPVGPGSGLAAHQGWIATHQNETQLGTTNGSAPEYTLEIPQVSGKAVTNPQFGGTKAFTHQQKGSKGNNYFFTLAVPAPNAIVGVRPTYAGVGSDSPQILAAGLIFVYNQVTLSGVQLQGGAQLFTPCFETDEKNFSAASLGIHFSRIDQSPDKGHGHAMAATFVFLHSISHLVRRSPLTQCARQKKEKHCSAPAMTARCRSCRSRRAVETRPNQKSSAASRLLLS
jgi:hypothetical protein